MIASHLRLNKTEIEKLFKKGRLFKDEGLVLRFAFGRSDSSRFAIIIPKKVAAKATERNRLKRKAMIILEKIAEDSAKKYDLAITFKKVPSEGELESMIKKAIGKAIGEP